MSDHDLLPGADVHLSAEELVDLAEGSLSAEDERRLRGHLELCADCERLVRDLSSYPDLEPPGAAYRIKPEELRSTLGALRARTLSLSQGPEASHPSAAIETEAATGNNDPRDQGPPAGARSRWGWWLAAAAVLMSLGWGWQERKVAQGLRRELSELGIQVGTLEERLLRPLANVKVIQLQADGDPRRGSGAWTLPLATSGTLIVVQTQEEPLPKGRYTVEIHRANGERVLRVEGLEPEPMGVSIFLPPAALATGEYWLRLLRAGQEVHPAPIAFRVTE